MLKAWLRSLPDPLLPKDIQARLAAEHVGSRTTPQAMKDELSMLPPYNYYLLFAITCHIAILLSKSEKNKMTYHNLCVCFQPCIGIEGFCFWFLVCDWANCWQGCWTEKDYYEREEEMRIMETAPNSSASHASGYFADHGERGSNDGQLSPMESIGRRRPSGVAVSLRPKGEQRGRSTPPNIEPVPSLSPMRLNVSD